MLISVQIQGAFKQNGIILITTAEKKLLIVLIYFAIHSVIDTVQHTLYNIFIDKIFEDISQHFACEAGGYIEGKCSRELFENSSLSMTVILARILFGFLPVVSLVFVLNIPDLKEKIMIGCCFKGKQRELRRKKMATQIIRKRTTVKAAL